MTTQRAWWACPNDPPCDHPSVVHDWEDFEGDNPTCCVDGCGCGKASEPTSPWPPYPMPVERYCLDSGWPVRMIPGDRCRIHGAELRMCTTDVRPAQCQHPHPSPNHPVPTCSECGRTIPAAP